MGGGGRDSLCKLGLAGLSWGSGGSRLPSSLGHFCFGDSQGTLKRGWGVGECRVEGEAKLGPEEKQERKRGWGGGKAREGGGSPSWGRNPGPPWQSRPGKAILQMEGINGAGEGPTVIARGRREECGVCVWIWEGREKQTHQTRRKWKRRRRNGDTAAETETRGTGETGLR